MIKKRQILVIIILILLLMLNVRLTYTDYDNNLAESVGLRSSNIIEIETNDNNSNGNNDNNLFSDLDVESTNRIEEVYEKNELIFLVYTILITIIGMSIFILLGKNKNFDEGIIFPVKNKDDISKYGKIISLILYVLFIYSIIGFNQLNDFIMNISELEILFYIILGTPFFLLYLAYDNMKFINYSYILSFLVFGVNVLFLINIYTSGYGYEFSFFDILGVVLSFGGLILIIYLPLVNKKI